MHRNTSLIDLFCYANSPRKKRVLGACEYNFKANRVNKWAHITALKSKFKNCLGSPKSIHMKKMSQFGLGLHEVFRGDVPQDFFILKK